MKLYLLSLLYASLSLAPVYAKQTDNPPELVKPEELGEIGKNDGIMLIDLMVGGTAPSITIAELGHKLEESYESANRLDAYTTFKLPLKDKSNGFYVLNLPEGVYQITKVNAPYFNLPHELDTKFDVKWRFTIRNNKVNYIGKLNIEHERSEKHVDIMLLNRLATDLDKITTASNSLKQSLPIANGIAYRDTYLDLLNINSGQH